MLDLPLNRLAPLAGRDLELVVLIAGSPRSKYDVFWSGFAIVTAVCIFVVSHLLLCEGYTNPHADLLSHLPNDRAVPVLKCPAPGNERTSLLTFWGH